MILKDLADFKHFLKGKNYIVGCVKVAKLLILNDLQAGKIYTHTFPHLSSPAGFKHLLKAG